MSSVLMIGVKPPHLAAMRESLHRDGCQVFSASQVDAALELAERIRPTVILLGDELESGKQLDACQRMRVRLDGRHDPLFLLAPRSSLADDGNGQAGRAVDESAATDYQLLAACIHSFVERSGRRESEQLTRGELEIDRQRFQARAAGRELSLTLTEFRILWTLAENPGFVFSRRELVEACRTDDYPVQERTIDVHIKSIRRKLEELAELVETVRGVGYRLRDA